MLNFLELLIYILIDTIHQANTYSIIPQISHQHYNQDDSYDLLVKLLLIPQRDNQINSFKLDPIYPLTL
jgi:hypothetical protein